MATKENESLGELKILQLLNIEPLKSDPASVHVLACLDHDDWHFVVMPFVDKSDERPL